MLNIFFMLRLFFPQRRRFSNGMRKWVQCDDFILFSFPTSPLASFCVQKLLFSSDLFPEKIYTESFYYLNVVLPPYLRTIALQLRPMLPFTFFLFSSLFFFGRNEKKNPFLVFFSRFLYKKIAMEGWCGWGGRVAHLYGTSEMKKNEKSSKWCTRFFAFFLSPFLIGFFLLVFFCIISRLRTLYGGNIIVSAIPFFPAMHINLLE